MIKIYLDIPLLGCFLGWIQDTTLLWMVSQITSTRTKMLRLLAGGAIGGIFQFFLLVNQASGGMVHSWILAPAVFIVIVPLIMLNLAFYPIAIKKGFTVLGYFYLISFLLSGIHWGIDSINQRFFHFEMTYWWRFCLHLTIIFVLGELGWGIIHRRIWEEICLYPIKIGWGNDQLDLTALLDTGNRLHDPLTKVPVIIVELNKIKHLLPQEFIETIQNIQSGDFKVGWNLPDFWEERLRILPFNSIEKEHGILIGFRPDRLIVQQKQKEVINQNVVVGLCQRDLSPEGAFHALIPPSVLKE